MVEQKDTLILIVDDNPNNLKVLGAMLSSRGHKVALAANGEECLSFIDKQLPDLVFLDIMMPGLNGFEVCEKLKNDSRTSEIPVIFISALSNPQQIARAFESGGSDYITKPINRSDILARAKVHLDIKKEHEKLRNQIAEMELKINELEKLLR